MRLASLLAALLPVHAAALPLVEARPLLGERTSLPPLAVASILAPNMIPISPRAVVPALMASADPKEGPAANGAESRQPGGKQAGDGNNGDGGRGMFDGARA